MKSVEEIKESSNYLRGKILEELDNSESSFSKETIQLLKFHGMYQQENRDTRRSQLKEKTYSLMLRGRIPGGRLSSEQYLIWDKIATDYADGSLRLTTRQSIQLHAVLKSNIKKVIQEIKRTLHSTEAACGDIVRNVTQVLNPFAEAKYEELELYVDQFSNHFKARSNAFSEIWLDGIKLDQDSEPIYGEQYLPRKFKVAFTLEGDNSIDVLTNDLSFAATLENKKITGFHVFAGGGLGMTHKKPETYPRLADYVGWIKSKNLIEISETIVRTYRDNGNRENRKTARLKYLIDLKGLNWFKEELEERSGLHFEKRSYKEWEIPDYSGWNLSNDGTWSLGLVIYSGRIKDSNDYKIKTAIAEIAKKFKVNFQITADQNLLIQSVNELEKNGINALLEKYHVEIAKTSELSKRALACPALPTCGLAITESERILPELLEKINQLLKSESLEYEAPLFRMTGCPNGCARPYSAEIALVGRSKEQYSLYLGGSFEGTRLARQYKDLVHIDQIEIEFLKLIRFWKTNRNLNERFGDFINRIGLEELHEKLEGAN
jgi:sulfite reductase beta subunit-like hemoprotein